MDPLARAAGWIIAIGGALAIVYKGVVWVVKGLRKVVRLADDLLGEPARPGHPRRPGLMERVATIEQRLDVLEELRPNGGASLHDKVNRIAVATGANEAP